MAEQRLIELTRRPLLPPSRFKVNLETGASGTVSKVVRSWPWTDSTRPTRSMSIWPLSCGDDVGEFSFAAVARR